MKPNFKLPNTKQCIVRYVDNEGKMQDLLMETPANNAQLFHTMLMGHKIGYGQIRTVKAVTAELIVPGNFQRNFQTVNRDTLERRADAKRRRIEPMFV